jgi:signal peptidase II
MMGTPGQRWIFMSLSVIAIIIFALYLYLGNADSMLSAISLSMIISGGIGNMVDRLGFGFYVNPLTGEGEVIDFIDFCGIWDAIFNGADSFVCVGAGLLILAMVLEIIKESKAEKAKASEKGKK